MMHYIYYLIQMLVVLNWISKLIMQQAHAEQRVQHLINFIDTENQIQINTKPINNSNDKHSFLSFC